MHVLPAHSAMTQNPNVRVKTYRQKCVILWPPADAPHPVVYDYLGGYIRMYSGLTTLTDSPSTLKVDITIQPASVIHTFGLLSTLSETYCVLSGLVWPDSGWCIHRPTVPGPPLDAQRLFLQNGHLSLCVPESRAEHRLLRRLNTLLVP